jgi:hypothetical protein
MKVEEADRQTRVLRARSSEQFTTCQRLLDEAMRLHVKWPVSKDPSGAEAFAQEVAQFVGRGLQIRLSLTRPVRVAYAQEAALGTTIFRKVLLMASELVPALFDKCCMSDLARCIFDHGSHIIPLKPLSGHELRHRFAMEPLMIGLWTMYFDVCNPRERQALMQATDAQLLQVFAGIRSDGDRVPTPATLAKRLLGHGDATPRTQLDGHGSIFPM